VAFLPGGQQLVIGSGDPEDAERDAARGAGAVLWDLAGEREVRRFSDSVAPTKVATALAVSPDGSVVAIVDGLNRVDLWDVRTGERRGRMNTRTGIANLAFSRDGRALAVGSVDSVRVWAVDSLVETAMIETTAQADSIAFAGAGSKLAVLSSAVIELHPLRTSDLIAAACQRLERNLSPAEWAANLGEGEPYHETCPGLPAAPASSAAPTTAEQTSPQTRSEPAQRQREASPAEPGAPSPAGAGKSPSGTGPVTAFRDCAECPEMVVLPAGSFTMGTPSETSQRTDEGPPRRINVTSFALGKYEVTRREFQYFLDHTGAKRAERCMPVGGKDHAANEPEVCLNDALTMGFLKWLSAMSTHSYRLPTDVEWEYAARGGTSTLRFWGNEASRACQFANVSDRSAQRRFNWDGVHACDDGYSAVAPVGRFPPNPFGLHDILGNVSEVVREGLLRGGSYDDGPAMVSSASRHRDDTSDWSTEGIRVARAAP